MSYQWRTLSRSFETVLYHNHKRIYRGKLLEDSPYLQVHDDLSLVHIFCINLDPVDPQGLHRNTGKHYSCCTTPAHQHNNDTSTPPQTPTRLPQGWPLSWPRMETIYETSVYVSDVHVYVHVLTSCDSAETTHDQTERGSLCLLCRSCWSRRCWGGSWTPSPLARWSHGTVSPQTGRCRATSASLSEGEMGRKRWPLESRRHKLKKKKKNLAFSHHLIEGHVRVCAVRLCTGTSLTLWMMVSFKYSQRCSI